MSPATVPPDPGGSKDPCIARGGQAGKEPESANAVLTMQETEAQTVSRSTDTEHFSNFQLAQVNK